MINPVAMLNSLPTTSFALKGAIWMSSLSVETSKYSFSFGQ